MKTLTLILGLLFVQNSFATGETSCTFKTDAVSVQAYTLNSRLPGNPVLNASVVVERDELSSVTLDKSDLVGWWSHGETLNMHFMKPATGSDKADTQLIIETTYQDNGEYNFTGKLYFIGPEGHKLRGNVECELG